MAFGPVQLLVVGFDRHGGHDEVLAEFERLRDSEVVRLIDRLVVHKDANGVVKRADDAGAAEGAAVEALIGLAGRPGAADDGSPAPEEEFWSLDEAIPNDSDAVIVLVEHRWAIGTRDTIRAAGGTAVADAWIHPDDLAAAGLSAPGGEG